MNVDGTEPTFIRRKFTITEELDDVLTKLAERNYQGNVSLCIRAAIEDHRSTLDGTDSEQFVAKRLAIQLDEVENQQEVIRTAYIVNRDWRTYSDDINSIDLHRPWTARYDPVLWNPHLTGSNYEVDERSADHLQRFWKRYASEISFEDGAPFERSLSRFNEIYRRSNPKDQLVDAVIVFEGMLQKGVKIGGLGTTMALIGSILLDGRTGRSREELRSFFRSLYHARSEIVHKDAQWDSILDSDDFDPVGDDDPSIREFVEETRDVASEAILLYMDQSARNDRSIGDTNTLIYNAMRDAGSPYLGLERESGGVSRQVFNLPGDAAELVRLIAD